MSWVEIGLISDKTRDRKVLNILGMQNKMAEKREHMEKELVEKELSQLLEVTLKLEDELNLTDYE